MSRPTFIAKGTPLGDWLDRVGDMLTVPEDSVRPAFALLWGWADAGSDALNLRNVEMRWGGENRANESLFYNGLFWFRILRCDRWPCYVGFSVRWSSSVTTKAFLQSHFGIKGNGRWAMGGYWLVLWPLFIWIGLPWWLWWLYAWSLFMIRVQSDRSGAAGMDYINDGQATGWHYGGK